ncbi:hypothetical protein KW799_01505 [Candidatus Parcubacteria bacterium]|nr:hypothetical protein [Candidatus Parcubacteria bacterium]
MRISQEILQNKLASIPEEIRQQAISDAVATTLSQIAKDHNLHIDQAGVLDEETLYVMLGLEKADGFTGKLRERLGISQEIAVEIVKDVNEKVFLSIRESLMKMHESEEEQTGTEATAETENLGTRESILAEIEDHAANLPPLPASGRIAPKPAIASTAAPAIQASQAPQQPRPETPKPVAEPPKPRGYAMDPYREPIG